MISIAADAVRHAWWGSSFAGGHVLHLAARRHDLAAGIAQCAFTDGVASALALPIVSATKVAALTVADTVAAGLGRDPVLVEAAGTPGRRTVQR